MLAVKNLHFAYPGESFSLKVPDLAVAAGEQVAIIGPSGCGKTTLARLIAGIEAAQSGEIEVMGQRVDQMSEAERRAFRAANIGFVFQNFELLDYLPALDNILLPYRVTKLRDPNATERARELATHLGIGELLRRRPARLSQGERQRVAIARALVTQPGLLLADEPTGNLDPEATRGILELLHREARERGATLLVITHDHASLDGFDRVIDMAKFHAGAGA